MIEFKYDTQLLIEGKNLNENEISEYFTKHFKGDCLLAVGDDELIKIHRIFFVCMRFSRYVEGFRILFNTW